MISGLLLGAIFIYPAFQILQVLSAQYLQSPDTSSSLILIGLVLTCLSLALALVIGPQTALLAELFPAKTRNSAATFPHNLAAGWIGGLLPLIVTWLNQKWDSDIAGLWYPTLFLAAGAIVAFMYLPETRDNSLLD